MENMIPIALFGIILVAVLLYAWLPGRQAMLAVMLGSAMFLPNSGYQVPILREYDKFTAASLSVLLAMVIFDYRRLARFRFHWIDIPMALWCLCPFVSSLTNDLGIYDGLAEVDGQIMQWGLPYLIGRLYFTDAVELGETARALFKAGLIMIPFCVVEILKGPLFHVKLYGFYPHNYWEQYRYNGWRPSVFFVHGLWLGWFMTLATLAGLFLWRGGRPRHIFYVPLRYLVPVLVAVTVYCKSTGALVLLAIGTGVLLAGRFRKVVLALLIVSPLIYVGLRVTQSWNGDQLVSMASSQLGDD
ncbi:MAG: O-antigen ligase domain-containing protein, partial [Phycisphaerae bacterium]